MSDFARKDHRLEEAIREAAAAFVARMAGPQSLITITSVFASNHGKQVTIRISVFPKEREAAALDFLIRQKDEMFAYVRKHVALARLPALHIDIDRGETNRQTVDDQLSKENKAD
jgi:ribosome-binding factor A